MLHTLDLEGTERVVCCGQGEVGIVSYRHGLVNENTTLCQVWRTECITWQILAAVFRTHPSRLQGRWCISRVQLGASLLKIPCSRAGRQRERGSGQEKALAPLSTLGLGCCGRTVMGITGACRFTGRSQKTIKAPLPFANAFRSCFISRQSWW